MKKVYSFIVITLFTASLLLVQGCEEESFETEENSLEAIEMTPVLERIMSMGYNLKDITETENSYVVEGDIVFMKRSNVLSRNSPGHSTSQYSIGILNNQPREINIYLKFTDHPGPDVLDAEPDPSGWISALDTAIENWNSASSNNCLILNEVPDQSDADITIYYHRDPESPLPDLTTSGHLGYANFPDSNLNPGNAVAINLEAFNSALGSNNTINELNASDSRSNLLTHELGHCIGFEHTNTDAGNLIPGINYTLDEYSVMNQGDSGFELPGGLSFNDRQAYNYLYGHCKGIITTPNASITGPTNLCSGDVVTYNLINGGNNVQWSVSSNFQVISTPTDTNITVQYTGGMPLGGTYIEAQFTDNSNTLITVRKEDITNGAPYPNSTAIVSGPNVLKYYQSGLFYTNENNFDNYSNVEWVVYSYNFPGAGQHFNIQSPAGNNPFNALIEVLPSAPVGNYVVQCRVSNSCGIYYIEKTLTVQEGRPQIFDL